MDIPIEKIELAGEFTKQCLLPELERDIGDAPLEREDFSLYVYGLEQNLRLLYDIVTKNADILFVQSLETEPFRINFILLLSEQSGCRRAPFKTEDKTLLAHLQSIVRQRYISILDDDIIFTSVLDKYKSKLRSNTWKKNIGAVYGYERFCELFYGNPKTKMTANDGIFILSVGTLLVEHFEEIYKNMGLNLFITLMKYGDKKSLTQSNIYETIYSQLMSPLIKTIKQETTMITHLNCLFSCAENDKSWETPSDWNKIDDILNDVLERITLESNRNITTMLLIFVAKFVSLPIRHNSVVRLALTVKEDPNTCSSFCLSNLIEIEKLRNVCKGYDSHLAYRWTKKLLALFSQQTFFGKSEDIGQSLRAVHYCYLFCIYPIAMKLIENEWVEFIQNFIPVLIGVYRFNKTDDNLVTDLKDFFETFLIHIESNKHTSSQEGNQVKVISEINEAIIELKGVSVE